MSASRLAWYLALGTAVAWTLKALAIWEAGGPGKTSLEDVGWAVGTLAFLLTWTTLGFALAAGRAIWLRIIAAAAGAVRLRALHGAGRRGGLAAEVDWLGSARRPDSGPSRS